MWWSFIDRMSLLIIKQRITLSKPPIFWAVGLVVTYVIYLYLVRKMLVEFVYINNKTFFTSSYK